MYNTFLEHETYLDKITGTFIVAPAELIKIRLQVGRDYHSHNELQRTWMVQFVLIYLTSRLQIKSEKRRGYKALQGVLE